MTLLRMTDLFTFGINGSLHPESCISAYKLCHLLIDYTRMITAAKRKLLEQPSNFYRLVPNAQGAHKNVEMTKNQQRAARKRVTDSETFSTLPGKLDHASVCAYKIPSFKSTTTTTPTLSVTPNYTETNF